MDLRKIKKLIDLLEESNLSEIEIKEGEESVRLARVRIGETAGAPGLPPRGAARWRAAHPGATEWCGPVRMLGSSCRRHRIPMVSQVDESS